MGHAIKTATGWDFSTDYAGVFTDPKNMELVIELREQLRVASKPATIILQPGDGTRYSFLLVPQTSQYKINGPTIETSGGYELQSIHPSHQTMTLLVTSLDGLVKGVASIMAGNDIDGIRHRIADKTDCDSPCTWEALSRLVEAVWSDRWQNG